MRSIATDRAIEFFLTVLSPFAMALYLAAYLVIAYTGWRRSPRLEPWRNR